LKKAIVNNGGDIWTDSGVEEIIIEKRRSRESGLRPRREARQSMHPLSSAIFLPSMLSKLFGEKLPC